MNTNGSGDLHISPRKCCAIPYDLLEHFTQNVFVFSCKINGKGFLGCPGVN